MPWPISRYHGPLSAPATSMPAAFHSASSAACVPDLSPRETNGAAFALIVFSAVYDVLALDAGRIALRADQDEVVVHHGKRFTPKPSATNFSSCALACTNTTSASPRWPVSSAWPVPCDDHLHVDAGLGLEHRQDVAEQAGVLRRGGRGDDDRLVLRRARARTSAAASATASRMRRFIMCFSSFRSRDRRAGTRRPRGVAGVAKKRAAAACSTRRPRARNTMSPASRRACPMSCVAITIFTPDAATARTMSSTALVAAGSRLAVGSSRNRISGSRASARASASRCCSPPDRRRAGRSREPVEADLQQQLGHAREPLARPAGSA